MRYILVVLLGVLFLASPAAAEVSIGIGLPGLSIGINMPTYPELTPIPDYPVYYAPRGNVNLFFYDGMYWAYQRDNWYASSWYNGPWGLVGPEAVPAYVLRIPVRYYRQPPAAWARWQRDAPPRWGERWGPDWEQHHRGWDKWDRRAVQERAPLPVYQRQYSGNRYPKAEEQQHVLLRDKYRYQPQEPVVRQHYEQHGALPPHQNAPAVSRPQPTVVQHEQPAPRPQVQQERPQPQQRPEQAQRPDRRQEQEKGQERHQDQEKGQEHNEKR